VLSSSFSAELPAGSNDAALHHALKACGHVSYAGQRDLAAKMFRVAKWHT
jgi:hypothetical protein